MAIVTTNESAVALVDSVTERPIAGLRVFKSTDHAEDFLRYCREKADAGALTTHDPGKMSTPVAALTWDRWEEDRVDGDTGYLKEPVA